MVEIWQSGRGGRTPEEGKEGDSCQYGSCKARRYLGTGDTKGVKIRIRKKAKNGFRGGEEGF